MQHVKIPRRARADLLAVLAAEGAGAQALAGWTTGEIVARLGGADWDVEQPARRLEALLRQPDGSIDPAARRAVLARLALAFPGKSRDFRLPASLRAEYGPAFLRLGRGLAAGADSDADGFAKDVRLVLGHTVPGGAQDIDVAFESGSAARLGRLKRAAAAGGRLVLGGGSPASAARLFARPERPWLQIHTDSRHLAEFTPEGWDRLYPRVAELLVLHPQYEGLVGLSWFYDPAVAQISPRLAYLRDRPLSHGAVAIRYGFSPQDVERATRTSPSRRALHEAGTYLPRCWAIYWPRQALIDWAKASGLSAARALAA